MICRFIIHTAMNYLVKISVLILTMLFCCGAADNGRVAMITVNKPEADRMEALFKAAIPLKDGIIYTKVPRGLIVSINEQYFFDRGAIKIRKSSLPILDALISVFNTLDTYCIIEDHSDPDGVDDSNYKSNWELTIARSSNIVQYFIRCGCINPDKVFGFGFGEFMPFKDNVAETGDMDNRIDFVFIDYEAKR